MKTKKILKINGTVIDRNQLENHLQKIASSHNIINKSQKDTYPVPHMLESFKKIQEVYNLLNEHLKLGIGIHPAGEWLLDNFYIIEQTVKQIQKELQEEYAARLTEQMIQTAKEAENKKVNNE